MDELVEVSLGDVCSFKAGDAFKKDFQGRERGDYPFIKVSDMNLEGNERIIARAANWVDARDVVKNRYTLHQPGSVVFAKIGIALTYNRRRMLISPTVIDNNMMAASPNEKHIDPIYLYYLLTTVDFNTIATGSALPFLTQRDLQKVAVKIHPRAAQLSVATTLGAIDEKIELNRRTNETLEVKARAIFKDWFVDFGPTRAKMEGHAPYLAPDLWALFPDHFGDETGLPQGWRLGTLSDVANTNAESWTTRNHPDIVEYVDLSNTKWGNIESISQLAWGEAPSRARRIAKTGDTIVGTTRPGNGSFAYVARDGLTASTGFAVLTPRAPKYRDITYIAATRPENIARLANLADGHGGAYPAVNANEVSDTELPVADDSVMLAFSMCVAPMRDRIERAKEESRTLAQTRDLLLPKLMSGEIRLREADQTAGEAL